MSGSHGQVRGAHGLLALVARAFVGAALARRGHGLGAPAADRVGAPLAPDLAERREVLAVGDVGAEGAERGAGDDVEGVVPLRRIRAGATLVQGGFLPCVLDA